MQTSYLDASTYGIGELITRKKKLAVPTHQRDFAWTDDDVEQFLSDILHAIEHIADEYFLGLIVLVGPSDGNWEILDGQQRLAMTTMMYSAIRQWLDANGFDDDARQIESEFIGVRRLGTEPTPRLTLNMMNRDIFSEFVVNKCSDQVLKEYSKNSAKGSSNRLLVDALRQCRSKIEGWVQEKSGNKEGRVQALYRIANFIETQAKVVCLELNSDVDAYIIFESLNHRGNALSALDLVKNYIFATIDGAHSEEIACNWQQMAETIIDRDADDFLKVVWTANFGRIQRGELYKEIKDKYKGSDGALELSRTLTIAGDPYIALEDSSHAIWANYGETCAHFIGVLKLLGAKQVRPVILSALKYIENVQDMERLLWGLLVLTVRYQTIGRKRTGALEITCAKIAHGLSSKLYNTLQEALLDLKRFMPTDDEFFTDFSRYADSSNKRIAYFLATIEASVETKYIPYNFARVEQHIGARSDAVVTYILPKNPGKEWSTTLKNDPDLYAECLNRLGNRVLIEKTIFQQIGPMDYTQLSKVFDKSNFPPHK